MKQLLTAILVLLLSASVTLAQTPAHTKAKSKTEKAATGTSGPVKKDGTPDKRFKANKTAATQGPKKKDGTPDMRYKANKGTAKKKS